jgi:hypothetical protein
VVAFAAGVADLYVVDVGRIDSDSAAERIEHLGEQLLRVQMVKGARRSTFTAWGSNSVDDQRLRHRRPFSVAVSRRAMC